jgi:DNA-directed RNA polymerase subunit RPC12/RpoP
MARKTENTGFVCANCGKKTQALTNGSYRNHCPFCLYSLHVDNRPGDRANPCRALMKPVGLTYKGKKGWQIIHQCTKCGCRSVNKIAEDTIQPDDYSKLAMI